MNKFLRPFFNPSFTTARLFVVFLGIIFLNTACSTMNEPADTPETATQKVMEKRPYHFVLWQWQYTENADGTRINAVLPERYTVKFATDGSASFLVDCNRGVSAYAVNGEKLKFEPIALTKMFCFGVSQERDYLAGLNKVSGMTWQENTLKLLLSDGGVMVFAPAVKP